MSDEDLEWISRSPAPALPPIEPSEVLGWVRVDLAEARGLIVGPDEILVVVLPKFVGMADVSRHRENFRAVLGNRFVMITGGDVRLAKVNANDWGPNVIGEGVT